MNCVGYCTKCIYSALVNIHVGLNQGVQLSSELSCDKLFLNGRCDAGWLEGLQNTRVGVRSSCFILPSTGHLV